MIYLPNELKYLIVNWISTKKVITKLSILSNEWNKISHNIIVGNRNKLLIPFSKIEFFDLNILKWRNLIIVDSEYAFIICNKNYDNYKIQSIKYNYSFNGQNETLRNYGSIIELKNFYNKYLLYKNPLNIPTIKDLPKIESLTIQIGLIVNIDLPSLRKLKIIGYGYKNKQQIKYNTPNLEVLEVYKVNDFVLNNLPKLKKLKLDNCFNYNIDNIYHSHSLIYLSTNYNNKIRLDFNKLKQLRHLHYDSHNINDISPLINLISLELSLYSIKNDKLPYNYNDIKYVKYNNDSLNYYCGC
jgi:hypothetical protein